ncbi:histidine phosphatase family protein [Geobacter sp. AOG1]|uniref:SixA phosphatase family protein n=1 Tax=Geobacter sp. AOG1 TaxID=1566346 RepID=UPI001CC34577|nr:histidine phosphatase family protein [Geobacter sp. AOG1]GFE57915.1 phosphohistidine phosphatase [Geobacter sp. AOG1]
MKLCLVRHGEAVERTPLLNDSWRYLTCAGRESFRKISVKAGKQGLAPDRILTSPLVRAVQTAEILAQVLTYDGPVEVTEELSPGFDLAGFRRIVGQRVDCRELVLVGHEPDLGILAGHLLGTGGAVPLKKGAVLSLRLYVQGQEISAMFRWLISNNKVRKELR